MIAAAAATLLLAAQPQAPSVLAKPFAVMFSATAAYRAGLEEVCLPLISERRPLAEIEARAKLVRVSPAQAPDRVYRLPTMDFTQVTAWADGSCSVQVDRGSTEGFAMAARQLLAARPERFAPGRTDVPAPGLDRTVFCAAARPHPVMVTLATAQPGVRDRRAVSSTVLRSNYDDPESCRP